VIALAGAGIAFRVSVEGLERYTERMSAQAKEVVGRLRTEQPEPAPPPPAKRRSR
jgi:hypothetical protein